MRNILVTGSGGYVGSSLMPLLESRAIGVDLVTHVPEEKEANIAALGPLPTSIDTIIHLAAARADYGVKIADYFLRNVTQTEAFLNQLDTLDIKRFIHVSSVASFAGEVVSRTSKLSPDDAYRVSKFEQEQAVAAWCEKRGVELKILYPSAIYDDSYGGNTNIARLIRWSKHLPVIPEIDIYKSLTDLRSFCHLICELVDEAGDGQYLCIDLPVRTVTSILRERYPRKPVCRIPFFKHLLFLIASGFELFGFSQFYNRARAVKLFKSTDYSGKKGINTTRFSEVELSLKS